MTTPSQKIPQPIFLLSAPRSGSTWLQRILQTHPKVCGGEESYFFTLFGDPILRAKEMSKETRPLGPLVYIEEAEFKKLLLSLWEGVFESLYLSKPNAVYHLEKTPHHTLCIQSILELFPSAKFIILVRDSRAVSSSLAQAGKTWGTKLPTSVREAAVWWWRYNSHLLHFMSSLPSSAYLLVRYEDAIASPDRTLTCIADFLQIESTAFTQNLRPLSDLPPTAQTSDPDGFARMRGADGWIADLSVWEKVTVWRYTRKVMRELGYSCRPFR